MVDKENVESISGLAAMQKGMLFSYAVDPTSDAYVEQFDFTVSGDVDVAHMRTALTGVSRDFSILRSIFSFRNTDDPYQVVLKDWPPEVEVLDCRDSADADREIARFKAANRTRGFDLGKDVLLRVALIRVADLRWRFVFTFHHIILDGWSLGPLFGTLFGHYDGLVRSGSLEQRPEAHPYSDYIAWYERQRTDDAQRYWAEVLDGYERAADLPSHRLGDGFDLATHEFRLSADLYDALKAFAQETHVTQSAVFHAAWGVVLQKFNYTDDVVFGSVVSGRSIDLAGIEGMVGLFVNTQPVRVTTQDGDGFADVCRAVQETFRGANPYEHYPLHEIQAATPLKGDLLSHLIAFENYPMSEQLQTFSTADDKGIRFDSVEFVQRAGFDFHIVVVPGPYFGVTFTYNANLYSADLMAALERGLVRVLTAAVDDPQITVGDLGISDPVEDHGPVAAAAPAASSVPLDSSLVAVMKQIVATHGDRTALIWRGRKYSYRTLDRWSDAVAWRLRELGVGPGVGVGVLADRRPELVVAMLGVMKNGDHYIPIDKNDATPRIEYVLADAGARYLCTVAEFAAKVPGSAEVILVDEPADDVPEFPWVRDLNDANAYLMYTSGSTGKPKGCTITHRNILRLFADQTFFEYGDEQVIMLTSSPAFDVCTFEIWGALLFGGTLVLPDELDILDGDRLRDMITRTGVRSLWLTSPLFNQLCDHDPAIFASLEHLLIGGSALSVPHIAKVRDACPDVRVTNGYGPTENTTFSTTHEVRPEDLQRDRIPIGRALTHSTAYVLDRGLNLLPPGAIGELCVGGAGVSPGYHRRPELNETRFVTVPTVPDQRLYRTGDLARVLPDGTLDYIGRADDQVKINGFRVELGEVESVLRSLDRIEDAAVIAVESGGNKRLHGYYVAAATVPAMDVRRELTARVAGYMIPAALVQVDRIPLNKSGKVDRRRLAEVPVEAGADRPAPDLRNLSDTERVLVEIVADILSTPHIDIHRNFFEIGINSLSLLSINNRLRKRVDRDLPLKLYFEHTSIAALAAFLDRAGDTVEAEPEDTAAEEEVERAAVMTSQLLRQFADEPEGHLDSV